MVLLRFLMNRESNWNDCLETFSSVKITPDRAKANSIIETSLGRIEFAEEKEIKENNANYIFEDYYSSVLELMHAITILDGFKVSNHICLGYYLNDILKQAKLFRLFDDCRYKRNLLLYYGKRMDFETANNAIQKCKTLIKELSTILKEK